MKRCINPNCGAELDDNAKFCMECGTKQPQEYVCPACGAKFDQPTKFCMECGAKMDGSGGAPKASGMSIGDNNAISAKDIIGGDKIEAQNYVVNNVMGPQKSEAEMKMDNLSMKKMSKEYIREEMAKAKDFEKKNNFFGAASIYRELASEDNVDAVCSLLSLDYNKQFTIEASERNSLMNKLSEAVGSGHPEALFLVGVNTLDNNYAGGIDYLNRAVQNGSKKAVDFLDRYYGYNDDGTRKEVTEEAFSWFEKSAEMGSSEGQYLLACCYHNGDIVEKSPKDAYEWYEKASFNQHPYATYMVGEYYYHGWWHATNRNIAKDNFLKAAKQGVTEAQFCYGEICYKDKKYSEAEDWLKPAADKGNMVAQYYMGELCDAWNQINAEKALVWYKKSAAQGYMPAYTSIGCIYMNKDCNLVDYNEAEKWLKPAAESGDEFAQSQYGVCCANHYDLSEAGIREAGKYLRMAADRGDEEAIDTIKECYLELDYGWDMKAIDWLAEKVEKDPKVWGWAQKMIGRCYSDLIKYGYSDGTELTEEEKQYAKQQAQKWGTGISSSILASHREAQQTTSQPAHQTKPQPATQPAAPTKTESSSGGASKVQVVLITAGAQKLFVVKEVKEYLNIGLKEAMGLVSDNLPNVIAELDENKAKEFYNILTGLGANVEIRTGGEPKVQPQPAPQQTKTSYTNEEIDKLDNQYAYNADGSYKGGTKESLEWFKKSAGFGSACGQYILGRYYAYGDMVEQNYSEAVKWFRKSAEQGFSSAQNHLGYCYLNGKGVEEDAAEAIKWFMKGAEQGHTAAESNVGFCYYKGYGVEKNYVEAIKWFELAGNKGDAFSQGYLGDCYNYAYGVKQDYEMAFKWYSLAADQNDAYAQLKVGDFYYEGKGREVNAEEAVKWYILAAEQGQSDAQNNLGYSYHYGIGIAQNLEEAAKWYLKAAEQGEINAMVNIGYCYQHGEGVVKDLNKAVEWYQKAADKGSDKAKKQLENIKNESKKATIGGQSLIDVDEVKDTLKDVKNTVKGIFGKLFK